MNHAKQAEVFQKIQQLLEQYQTLLETLNQESKILKSHQPDALLALTEKKQAELDALISTENTLTSLLKIGSTDNLSAHLQKWFRDHKNEDTKYLKAHETLETTIAACRRQNIINGSAVHTSLDVTRKLLQVSATGENSEQTYNKKGSLK